MNDEQTKDLSKLVKSLKENMKLALEKIESSSYRYDTTYFLFEVCKEGFEVKKSLPDYMIEERIIEKGYKTLLKYTSSDKERTKLEKELKSFHEERTNFYYNMIYYSAQTINKNLKIVEQLDKGKKLTGLEHPWGWINWTNKELKEENLELLKKQMNRLVKKFNYYSKDNLTLNQILKHYSSQIRRDLDACFMALGIKPLPQKQG